MTIKRIVPDITSTRIDESRDFYTGFLGMDLAMDMGWILTFVSPGQRTAQLTLMAPSSGACPNPRISIEVDDVDALHARAVERNLPVVYPLTDEPWGVRRFFVKDPDGTVINVMCHLPASAGPAAAEDKGA